MRRRALTALVSFAAACTTPPSRSATTALPEQRRAFEFLMTLEDVDSAHVGAVGNLSLPARAFRLVRERADAEASFLSLVSDAKRGGRLVALCGLKVMRSPRYPERLDAARDWSGSVGGIHGCLVGESRPVSEVVREIESGQLCESYEGADESPETRARYRAEPFPPQ